jgi:hypothetical protein
MKNFDYALLGWSENCECELHTPYNHSHQFTYQVDLKKQCEYCNSELFPNTQVFGNEFGKNRTVLHNAYTCTCTCGYATQHICYDGPSKSPSQLAENLGIRLFKA